MPVNDCRIISLSMVKNEQDIIEPFIRHNSRYVDFMIIVDNASVDLTRRIAIDCARELKTIIIAGSEEFAYNQAERMTRLLHYCQSAFLPVLSCCSMLTSSFPPQIDMHLSGR
jgi:hypothetical protein